MIKNTIINQPKKLIHYNILLKLSIRCKIYGSLNMMQYFQISFTTKSQLITSLSQDYQYYIMYLETFSIGLSSDL